MTVSLVVLLSVVIHGGSQLLLARDRLGVKPLYYAETSEAFFGTNDFYPYVRSELRRHDPGTIDVHGWTLRTRASPRNGREKKRGRPLGHPRCFGRDSTWNAAARPKESPDAPSSAGRTRDLSA